MKTIKIFFCLLIALVTVSCDENGYLRDVYVAPEADFSIEKDTYDVFESVHFTNKGSGQYYVVYPGDANHVYGKVGDTGFATAADGSFSYSYEEPGTFEAVWVASSVNEDGVVESKTASVTVKVVALDGGLDNLRINNIYKMSEYSGTVYYTSYGEFISDDMLICPILFDAWRDATFNSIKAKQLVNFELSSSSASMYWINPDGEEKQIISGATASRIVEFTRNGKLAIQNFRVITASGVVSNYYVAPVMIPKITKFTVAGVSATIKRDIAYYNCYDITLKVPADVDLSNVVPEFETMNNDANLIDGTNCHVFVNGVEQVSGTSAVDFSNGPVTYTIDYTMLGETNPKLSQQATAVVTITR
ncbi:MAG: hypothetical protein ACI4A8_03035 [Muribaculaceae bacterium]